MSSRSSSKSSSRKRSSHVSKRDTERFNKTSSELGNTLVVLRGQLKDLKREIRNDQRGVKEYEDHLDLLKRQRVQLQKRYDSNAKWAEEFDAAIGPFENTYSSLTDSINTSIDTSIPPEVN